MKYYLKKAWKTNTLNIAIQIIYAVLYTMTNLTMIWMMQAILDREMNAFLSRLAVHTALWTVVGAFSTMATWSNSRSKLKMNNLIRADIAATLLKKSYQDFHSQQSGEYLSWFSNDVNQITSLGWVSFFGIICVAAQIVTSIIALAKIHWSLLAASALVSVVVVNVPKLMKKRVEKLSEECAKEQAQAMSKMKDLLLGMDVLRSLGRADRFLTGNRKASEQTELPRHRQTYVKAYFDQAIDFVNLLGQIFIYCLIGVLAIRGDILPSVILGGGNLCGAVCGGFVTIGQFRLSMQASKPYFDKITAHAEDCPGETVSPISVHDTITVDDLDFQYDEKPILKDASFRFEKGGKYALTGPSGCGKSTLLKLILGWLPDYTGSIRFDGQDARGFTADQIQGEMSYIEQNVFLFNTTIRDNITLGESFTDEQIEKAIEGSALDGDLVHMPLGLETPVGEDGGNLSGGQKQRVAIARALIHGRSILLMDEGTSALDQKNADIVEENLLNNPDLTLVMVSHHLSPERKAEFTKVYELEPVMCGESI